MKNDFDPKEQINDLAAILNQPDKFAEVFCKAAAGQKSIDNALKAIVIDLIQKDHSTREYIKTVIKEYEKEAWQLLIKRGLGAAWTLIVVIISAIATTFIKKIT